MEEGVAAHRVYWKDAGTWDGAALGSKGEVGGGSHREGCRGGLPWAIPESSGHCNSPPVRQRGNFIRVKNHLAFLRMQIGSTEALCVS